MSNNLINNFSYNRFDVRLSNHKFYDLTLSSESFTIETPSSFTITGDSIFNIDFNNINIFPSGDTSATTIYSLSSWVDSINTGVTLNDIGLTGVDNGLIRFARESGDTANTIQVSAMTGSSLTIPSGDTKLFLNQVSGNTGLYTYPMEYVSGETLSYLSLSGGFYQGFYKLHSYDYQVLPNRFNDGFTLSFWLNKQLGGSMSGVTILNDLYPNNKGFFFFLGTRAENKFWNVFEGLNTGCSSGCTTEFCDSGVTITTGCTIPKETTTYTSEGVLISPDGYNSTDVCNKFLIYDRTRSGYTVCNIDQDACLEVSERTPVANNYDNLFVTLSRSRSGMTICDLTGRTTPDYIIEKDYLQDIIDGVIGFRVKDDGSIGYRKLIYSGGCIDSGFTSGYTIEESYSQSGLVNDNVWTNVSVRYLPNSELISGCTESLPRTGGRLMFYIDGKLKYSVDNFTEVIPKALNEHRSKQQGVAYNISIGGGSQGLIDTITFDGPDLLDRNLPIQENFAGSFIGYISSVRMFDSKLCYCTVSDIYNKEKHIYGKQ